MATQVCSWPESLLPGSACSHCLSGLATGNFLFLPKHLHGFQAAATTLPAQPGYWQEWTDETAAGEKGGRETIQEPKHGPYASAIPTFLSHQETRDINGT